MDNRSIASDFSIIPDINHADRRNSVEAETDEVENEFEKLKMRESILQALTSSSSSALCNKVDFVKIELVGNDDNCHISVTYVFPLDFCSKSTDRLALYKVGFSCLQDFVCFQWVPVQNIVDESSRLILPQTVIFKESIPKTDDFYQFGYLSTDGQIIGVSAAFQLSQLRVSESKEREEECELYESQKSLCHELNQKIIKYEQKLESLMAVEEENAHLKMSCSEFEVKLNENAKELHTFEDLYEENLKQKDELYGKTEKLSQDLNNLNEECTAFKEQLKTAYETIVELKQDKEMLHKENSQWMERHSVVMQDLENLKAILAKNKQIMETKNREKEASEKIASDLSERLEIARKEYQTVALSNLYFSKRLAQYQKESTSDMESTKLPDESWMYVSPTIQSNGATYESEPGEIPIDETANIIDPKVQASTISVSTCESSNCSQTAQQITESVNRKMEDIVSQLTKQIDSLKMELAKKDEKTYCELHHYNQQSHLAENNQCSVEGANLHSIAISLGQRNNNSPSHSFPDSNSFLASQRTAPVFLPKHTSFSSPNLPPSVASLLETDAASQVSETLSQALATPSVTSVQASSLSTRLSTAISESIQFGISSDHNSLTSMANFAASSPPMYSNQEVIADGSTPQMVVQSFQASQRALQPQMLPLIPSQVLMPEATTSARNAAVLHHFAETSNSRNVVTDSDDDEYHSSGENDVNETEDTISCMFCPEVFPADSSQLLQEHVHKHLERMCPMCSVVFRKDDENFEKHVYSHFPEDREPPKREDSSGPWNFVHNFHLLDID